MSEYPQVKFDKITLLADGMFEVTGIRLLDDREGEVGYTQVIPFDVHVAMEVSIQENPINSSFQPLSRAMMHVDLVSTTAMNALEHALAVPNLMNILVPFFIDFGQDNIQDMQENLAIKDSSVKVVDRRDDVRVAHLEMVNNETVHIASMSYKNSRVPFQFRSTFRNGIHSLTTNIISGMEAEAVEMARHLPLFERVVREKAMHAMIEQRVGGVHIKGAA